MRRITILTRKNISRATVAVFLFLVGASQAAAQFGLGEATPAGIKHEIKSSIATIIIGILQYVGAIFLVLVVVGGIMWMVSGGNEQRVERAKKIITSAVIGLVIIMTAYAITLFITEALEGSLTDTPTGACNPAQDPNCPPQ